ncbi:serine hydrolase [Erysipelothrix inopinata]|uniref:Serine hydrolase n=1 Tax=Erysipelothrix inopinata TaxID=225084 RepID=A0A7G9RX47_9FIRM|nr:serine hydrolase [Erysipelothrix inopinata]QNN60172.1 serine hydrolase [Erysipelothrix inopinata]
MKQNAQYWDNITKTIQSQYSNIRGISVVYNNETVYEQFFKTRAPEQKFNVASVTKSIVSLLIGIAIDQGHIPSIDDKVMTYFPEYHFNDTNRIRDSITIKNLLTMTAPYPFPAWNEPFLRMARSEDWVEYSLGTLGKGCRVGTFKYSTSGTHILSALLTKATGMSAREYANQNLFKPIGIEEIPLYPMKFDQEHIFGNKVRGWVSDPLGYSTGGWGLNLSISDMVKIGQLCLQRGVWNQKRIVSESWILESTTTDKNNYGYLWWIGDREREYIATGSGGNIIYVNEPDNLIIAIASTIISRPKDRKYLVEDIRTLLELK